MIRRLVAVMGVVASLTLVGCASDVSGTPVAAGSQGTAQDGSKPSQEKGFDECALLEPSEVAGWVGTESMYVTSADVVGASDGTTRATCTYFPKSVPGMLGMKLSFVADADPEKFFAPFEKNFDNVIPLEIGDEAAAVGYSAAGTENHYYEVRAIEGTRGIHLFYPFKKGPGGDMPDVEDGADKWGKILTTAFERMPAELSIPDGKPKGPCADIDVAQASEVLGVELTTARTVEGESGAIDCTFGGSFGLLSITVLAEPSMVPSYAVKPQDVTHADIGDGARVRINEGNPGEQGALDALANAGDTVVAIQVSYGDGASGFTKPRPEDVELVRAIVDIMAGQD
jgi:hypothetical protein